MAEGGEGNTGIFQKAGSPQERAPRQLVEGSTGPRHGAPGSVPRYSLPASLALVLALALAWPQSRHFALRRCVDRVRAWFCFVLFGMGARS